MEKVFNGYPYRPLNAACKEIRLLELLPASSACNIACRIFHRSLDEPPIHDALSYTWSDPTVTEIIRLDSHDFHIPARLETTLRDLRLPDRARILWIDAICINQRNIPERNQQVELMRLIYEKAVLVRVWLDLEIDSTNPAFAQLALLDDRSSVEDLGENSAFWTPVLALFPQRYWTRVWIQQEVTCAVDFTIYCRRSCISGLGFLRFAELVVEKYDAATAKNIWVPVYQAVSTFGTKNLMDMRFLWRAKSALLTNVPLNQFHSQLEPLNQFHSHLLELLDRTRILQCTDPRDRVYGLMHMAMDYDHGAIRINYDLSVAQVYCSVAEYLIKKHSSLAFLHQVTQDSITSRHGLPTWLPDWDNARQPTSVIDMTRPSTLGLSPASGQVTGRPPVISPCGKILQVQGFHVDSLLALCLESLEELVEEPITVAMQIWMEVACTELKPYTSAPQRADIAKAQRSALMRTLVAGNEFDEMESAFDELCYFVDDPVQGEIPVRDLFSKLTGAGRRFMHAMALTFQDRTLFRSRKGAVGLVPKDAKSIDEIWILFGCPTPIVLRPEDETYSVVGIAYVDGMMKGEAVEGVPSQVEEGYRFGDYEVCTINLC